MSLPSKDDWILKVFTEPLTSSGAKPRTSCPKIFILRCRFLAMMVGMTIIAVARSSVRIPWHCWASRQWRPGTEPYSFELNLVSLLAMT